MSDVNWELLVAAFGLVLTLLAVAVTAVVKITNAMNKMREELLERIASVKEELLDRIASVKEELLDRIASVKEELKDTINSKQEEVKDTINSKHEEVKDGISESGKQTAVLAERTDGLVRESDRQSARLGNIEDHLRISPDDDQDSSDSPPSSSSDDVPKDHDSRSRQPEKRHSSISRARREDSSPRISAQRRKEK